MICATHMQFIQALELKAEAVDGDNVLTQWDDESFDIDGRSFYIVGCCQGWQRLKENGKGVGLCGRQHWQSHRASSAFHILSGLPQKPWNRNAMWRL